MSYSGTHWPKGLIHDLADRALRNRALALYQVFSKIPWFDLVFASASGKSAASSQEFEDPTAEDPTCKTGSKDAPSLPVTTIRSVITPPPTWDQVQFVSVTFRTSIQGKERFITCRVFFFYFPFQVSEAPNGADSLRQTRTTSWFQRLKTESFAPCVKTRLHAVPFFSRPQELRETGASEGESRAAIHLAHSSLARGRASRSLQSLNY